jgi:hypothetical protein
MTNLNIFKKLSKKNEKTKLKRKKKGKLGKEK